MHLIWKRRATLSLGNFEMPFGKKKVSMKFFACKLPVIGAIMTVFRCLFRMLFCKTITGRIPDCSCPFVGFRFAKKISPCLIILNC